MAAVATTEPPTTRVARRTFVIGIVGLPLWWIVGIAAVIPVLVALPMAWDLWSRRRTSLPPHFGWWLLFLVWALLGLGTLWATAPGTTDAGGSTRLLLFGFRYSLYLAGTVALLWIGNTPSRFLPDRLVHRVLASLFLVAVVGGLVGVISPDLTVTTLAERTLPGGLSGNKFVGTLVSAEVADVQEVLGDPEPRPKAPFAYTNTWGSVMALALVFFAAAAMSIRRRWRWAALPVLAVAAIPVVMSLNRGLWIALAAGGLGLLVLAAVRRHALALTGLVAVVFCAGLVVTSTPLGDTVLSRLEHPHSNDRRSQLIGATLDSMTDGSPAVGFGSTRDAAGTFVSIAGGATPDCAACGVPPLGTQGHLWLVLYSQGWIGAAFFLAFFVLSFVRTLRCRTTNNTIATFVVGIFLLQLTVYDTLGLPMLVVMAAIALAWREDESRARLPTIGRPAVAVVAGAAAVGAALGLLRAASADDELASTVAVALAPTPTYLEIEDRAAGLTLESFAPVPPTTSIDTEAALLLSEQALSRAGSRTGVRASELRQHLAVSAPPLSTVIEMTVTTRAPDDPSDAALAVAEEYLAERDRFLETRRADLVAHLEVALAASDPLDPAWTASRDYLRTAIDRLIAQRSEAGIVIRVGEARHVDHDPSVPVTSGIGLGALLGFGTVNAAQRSRRPACTR